MTVTLAWPRVAVLHSVTDIADDVESLFFVSTHLVQVSRHLMTYEASTWRVGAVALQGKVALKRPKTSGIGAIKQDGGARGYDMIEVENVFARPISIYQATGNTSLIITYLQL